MLLQFATSFQSTDDSPESGPWLALCAIGQSAVDYGPKALLHENKCALLIFNLVREVYSGNGCGCCKSGCTEP